MSLFKIETIENITPDTLTLDLGLSQRIIEKYIESDVVDVYAWKHELFLPVHIIKNAVRDMEELKYSLKLIMNGLAQVVREVSHFDEETGEIIIDTPVQYNTIPLNEEDLKNTFFTLVKADYEIKKSGEYIITDEDLRTLTDTVTTNYIKYCDNSGNGTFEIFSTLITD